MIRSAVFVLVSSLGVSSGADPDQKPSPPYVLDRDKKQVVRLDATGKEIWSATFADDIGSVRPPDLLWDDNRVYLSHKDSVTALDASKGKTLWHAEEPIRYGLLLSDGLLLGTGPIKNMDGTFSTWLFACDVANGKVAFKIRLPKDMSDPDEVTQIDKLFLVQIVEHPGGQGHALLIDLKGTIRHELDPQVVCGRQCGEDMVFLTSKNVVRITAKDKVVWTVPLKDPEWIAGGELIEVPGGDLIASQFGCINDSGVSLIRFDPADGKEKWQVHCKGLGVAHSEYYHSAKVVVNGENVRVASEGPGGTFVEVLDVKTGKQLERTRKDR